MEREFKFKLSLKDVKYLQEILLVKDHQRKA